MRARSANQPWLLIRASPSASPVQTSPHACTPGPGWSRMYALPDHSFVHFTYRSHSGFSSDLVPYDFRYWSASRTVGGLASLSNSTATSFTTGAVALSETHRRSESLHPSSPVAISRFRSGRASSGLKRTRYASARACAIHEYGFGGSFSLTIICDLVAPVPNLTRSEPSTSSFAWSVVRTNASAQESSN